MNISFTIGFLLGMPFGAAAFSVALLLIHDAREFRRRVGPVNERQREETKGPQCDNCGAFHDPPRDDDCFLVALGAASIRGSEDKFVRAVAKSVTTPTPGRPLKWKTNANGGQC